MAGASGARRIVLNRAAFDEINLAMADGAFELAKAVVESAGVPDAAPYGQGLIEGGGVVAYVTNKRVAAWSTSGDTKVSKPRRSGKLSGITVIGGWGFPGRLVETGTVHMAGQPFATPALMSTLPEAEAFMKAAAKRGGILGAKLRAKREAAP